MGNEDFTIKVLESMRSDNKEFYNAIYNLVKEQCRQIDLLNRQIAELKTGLNIQKQAVSNQMSEPQNGQNQIDEVMKSYK